MDRANQYLKEVFIPSYWNKNIVVNAHNLISEYTPLTDQVDLDAIFWPERVPKNKE
ncbi:MAG: hypothetical protein K0R08_2113 [Solimicrobium sp.]|jgi:hypothetical protein|nr:hypothetical protein [Solimicrobium sp.]